MEPRLAIIETSHRSGFVALATGPRVLSTRPLSEARRHTRDLAPMLAEQLAEQRWKARDLAGVIVSQGPGSYTGLRVGIMSAKTLAYATGCALLAVETLAAIALGTPADIEVIDVIADAQQDKLYVQRFSKQPQSRDWQAAGALRIVEFKMWCDTRDPKVFVSGPGLEIVGSRLPASIQVPNECWLPDSEGLLRPGLERWRRGERDDPFALEPIYLRPSSAEEKAAKP